MKFSDYKKASDVKGIWGFLMWFIRTKEFSWLIIVLLLLFISQSFKCHTKYFQYDPVIKWIKIEK